MYTYAKHLKALLDHLILTMAEQSARWAKCPDKDFTRNRKIPFTDLIRFLLAAGGNSLNKELYDYFKPAHLLVSASALVQQRNKLRPEALDYLFHQFNHLCDHSKMYRGYHLLAVDGTAVSYPGNAAQNTFMPKHGVNQYHVNALYDLLNKTYVDAVIQPQPKFNEAKAAWQMMTRQNVLHHAILIADRGYGGVNLIEHLNRIPGCDYVIRIKNNLWKELKDLPDAPFDIDLTLNLRTTQTKADKEAYAKGEAKWIAGPSKRRKYSAWDFETPFALTIRIVRFEIAENTYETVATSLSREQFSPKELKKLYHMRWGIETSFRELKYAIGVTNFHAKKCDLILQEIYARMIMYNFCECITMHVIVENDHNRKWQYQVNYTMAIHICRDFFKHTGQDPPDIEKLIKKYTLPIRPHRTDRRKVKTKPAVYFTYRVA
ncbi:MAG: IS4 family transposase [Pseudoramibacter sp.]